MVVVECVFNLQSATKLRAMEVQSSFVVSFLVCLLASVTNGM